MAEMKERKGKKKPRERAKMRKSSYYEVKDGSVKRTRRSCPKCGSGIFMAEHKDRQACGKCGYTEWKQGGK